jgi:hypothetical protein
MIARNSERNIGPVKLLNIKRKYVKRLVSIMWTQYQRVYVFRYKNRNPSNHNGNCASSAAILRKY